MNTRLELTDLIRFKGIWYCSFCEGPIHNNHPEGRGWLIRSADGVNWEQAAIFDWDCADVRDPILSVTSESLLMVNSSLYFTSRHPRTDYATTSHDPEATPQEAEKEKHIQGKYYQLDHPGTPENVDEPNVARQSVTWLSKDGTNWSSAFACSSGINTWRWQAKWHNGMGYSVGYDGKDKHGTLYRTRDGKQWRPLVESFFPNGQGTEATLAFDQQDAMHCLLRYSAQQTMCGFAKAPYYQEWQWRELDVDCGPEHGGRQPAGEVFRVHFGGPKMICTSDGQLIAAARMLWPWREDGKITLFRYDPDEALLTILAEVDGTSYPGLVEHEGELWISYARSRDNTAEDSSNHPSQISIARYSL